MGLVDEKQVFSPCPFREEALQPYIGIKDIVVIADDRVRPGGRIQAQLKGADPVLMGLGQQNLSAKLIRPFCQKLIDRPVYPVIMSLRVGTDIRIALSSQTQSFSFAVRVTVFMRRPFPRRNRKASSATVRVTVFAVR